MADLKSTHVRIGLRFLVTCNEFWGGWGGKEGLGKELISGISRARQD